jgi:hypothetical protein
MKNFPRFASPVSPEWRAYFRALLAWSKHGSAPPGKPPEDPLRPFRDAMDKSPKRLISYIPHISPALLGWFNPRPFHRLWRPRDSITRMVSRSQSRNSF